MRQKIVGDLSPVKTYAFGLESLWGWALVGFFMIEGAGFLLAGGVYLYIMAQAPRWPIGSPPPSLLYGTAFTVLMIASLVPNAWVGRAAARRRLGPSRIGTVLMAAIGVVLIALRAGELSSLNVRWDQDAYGSILWALMLLHTTHLVTDVADTALLGVFLYTHPATLERLSGVDDNAAYWTFVVVSWLPIYALVYWAPRWVP